MLKTRKTLILTFAILVIGLLSVACGGIPDSTNNGNNAEKNTHEHEEGEDHEHEERSPNNGAVIHITSPADGATFKADEVIAIQVEVENFVLSDTDGHWHVYIDGVSLGMVMGGRTELDLHDLEAGEHEISIYLSEFTHVELEDGASIHIHIEEAAEWPILSILSCPC